jgi:hypothetical protein
MHDSWAFPRFVCGRAAGQIALPFTLAQPRRQRRAWLPQGLDADGRKAWECLGWALGAVYNAQTARLTRNPLAKRRSSRQTRRTLSITPCEPLSWPPLARPWTRRHDHPTGVDASLLCQPPATRVIGTIAVQVARADGRESAS